ncbi:MAG: hypothetical protein ACTSQL_07865 [Promethearchaeota archaeon]
MWKTYSVDNSHFFRFAYFYGLLFSKSLFNKIKSIHPSLRSIVYFEDADQGIIEFDDYIYIGDIIQKELEDTGDGYKIKKATYLSEEKFFEILENKSFTRRWVYD